MSRNKVAHNLIPYYTAKHVFKLLQRKKQKTKNHDIAPYSYIVTHFQLLALKMISLHPLCHTHTLILENCSFLPFKGFRSFVKEKFKKLGKA